MKRFLIGIPAYNEQSTITKVIHSLPKKIPGVKTIDIVVVDDGSTDHTGEIVRQAGGDVIRHCMNRGLGGALKTILAYARKKQYDILVTFDADGQHNGNDIERLIQPILAGTSNVVIGTRWRTPDRVPSSRRIINKLANALTYVLFGISTSDSQSGLRAFDTKAIQSISVQADGMEVSSEFFREIYRNKLRFLEIPIHPVYTKYSQTKGQKLINFTSVSFELIMRFLRQ